MSNGMQKYLLNIQLKPCPFCGGNRVKLTFDIASNSIKGIYCSDCKGFTKFNGLISARADGQVWADTWNRRQNEAEIRPGKNCQNV